MLDKIAGIEQRYEELNQLLMEVGDNYQRATELSIERAELEPLVTKANRYRQALQQLDEARSFGDTADSELRQLAVAEIEELEPESRGPYAGAVGYFGFSGNMDTCIAIRTIVMKGDRAFLQAGAGIVADSDPAREYEETNSKLRALSEALALAERD